MSKWWVAQLIGLLDMRRDLRPLKRRTSFMGSVEEEILEGIERDIEQMIDGVDISDALEKIKSN